MEAAEYVIQKSRVTVLCLNELRLVNVSSNVTFGKGRWLGYERMNP
jgi:hypothetical protein